jgi:hypothetical protein
VFIIYSIHYFSVMGMDGKLFVGKGCKEKFRTGKLTFIYFIYKSFIKVFMFYCFRNCSIIYRGYLSFFHINTGSIFIEWYENKYFMSGGSHEWNMIIFIPQDENKPCINRKDLNFLFIIYIFSLLFFFFFFFLALHLKYFTLIFVIIDF